VNGMPLKCGKKIRYRVVTRQSGKIRLAFCGNKVIEAKKLKNLIA
jgi:hypothetical protein